MQRGQAACPALNEALPTLGAQQAGVGVQLLAGSAALDAERHLFMSEPLDTKVR